MCGIAGYLGHGNEEILRAMNESIAHRGPDASKLWLSPDSAVGLAHNRLAIIDLSPGGVQPMQSHDGRFVIVFNGEIYNFLELKKELASYPFKSNSDTEVILAAYETWGAEAFKKLRGMFAVALWDMHECELVLARDRAGKKPLYWSNSNGVFLFGSELKALRAHPSSPRELDLRSVGHYFAREYVPTPHTIYTDVQKLPPASYLRFKNTEISVETYWRACEHPAGVMSEQEALERFDTLLQKATSERLLSDVPLGVFLSGGIDSGAVAYYAARASSQKIKTFSIGFSEKSFDESSWARMVAAHIGTEHREEILSARDALVLVGDIPQVFDEPVADASVLPTLLLSRFTKQSVTVALGGDGADELLLGYPTFMAETYATFFGGLPKSAQKLLGAAADMLPTSATYMNLGFKARTFTHNFAQDPSARHLQWLGSFREDELSTLLAPEVAAQTRGITRELVEQWHAECPNLTGLNALSHLYFRTYLLDQVLVKVDRTSMRYGLEVRAPFLSHDIIEFLLSLPPELKYRNGRGKQLLRKLMHGRLPDAVIDRKKKGFGAPVGAWLRGELKSLVTDVLSPNNLAHSGLVNIAEVSKLLQEHQSGTRDHAKKLWTLLVFQMWYDVWEK